MCKHGIFLLCLNTHSMELLHHAPTMGMLYVQPGQWQRSLGLYLAALMFSHIKGRETLLCWESSAQICPGDLRECLVHSKDDRYLER